MRIIDESLLDIFRHKTKCHWCGLRTDGCDPAHAFSRGAGRLDIAINLIALCRECHTANHAGHIMRCDLLAIIAVREGVLQPDIEAVVWWIRRQPKESTPEQMFNAMSELNIAARAAAVKALAKHIAPCSGEEWDRQLAAVTTATNGGNRRRRVGVKTAERRHIEREANGRWRQRTKPPRTG